jgi:uncharacterized cupin superfamily protein
VSAPAKLLARAAGVPEGELIDWGPVAEPLGEPVSRTSGLLLHRDEGGANETGLWVCTPGRWRCLVERPEFCHFLAGRAVYVSDAGERLEVAAGDAAFFPAGWSGRCEVIETVRKTYMIR